jgi:hypothetical protein
MTRTIPSRRRPLAALVAAACGTLPASAGAAVPATASAAAPGRVDFAIGDVVATGADGTRRPLAKGAEVREGDTVDTGAGRAWIRFADGGYVSLQPNTAFRIDEYRWNGRPDGRERTTFSLTKGSFRTVTGQIGRSNRSAYRVTTPVATIGIRGTEYVATLGNSLTLTCGLGVCVVANAAGEVVLESGETVYVADAQTLGQRQTRKPVLPPAPPVEFRFPEQRGDDGSLLAVSSPQLMPDGPGYALAASFAGDGGEPTGTLLFPSDITADFDAQSQLESYDDGDGDSGARGTAMFADTGADGIVAWGRWTGGTTSGDGFPHPLDVEAPNPGFHYVVGMPTQELPAELEGTLADFDLAFVTTPTFSDSGSQSDDDFGDFVDATGALVANFISGSIKSSLLLDFTKNDLQIDGFAQVRPGFDFDSTANGFAFADSNAFSGSLSAVVRGFFAGENAERAVYAYEVFAPGYTVNGVAGFELDDFVDGDEFNND